MTVMGSSAPVVGVLGGMGPAATADFYRKLVEATPAHRDQDHLRTLIWSDPSIPDRAEAFLRGGPSPVRGLIAGARLLEESGADFIAVPCNTAHLFLGAVRRRAGIPVLDMIGSTVGEILTAGSGAEPPPGAVAVLGTAATMASGIYTDRLIGNGVAVLHPRDAEQHAVIAAITAVKAGEIERGVGLLAPVLEALARSGATRVVTACTELPILSERIDAGPQIVDPTAALARACVRSALMLPVTSAGR